MRVSAKFERQATGGEVLLFLEQLLRRPLETMAIAPSSPALSAAMAAAIPAGATSVAEFGAGTGRITREILRRGIAPGNLVLLETNGMFVEHLRAAFPGLTVLNNPAQALRTEESNRLGAVVSGLPLLSMPPQTQHAIVTAAFDNMAADGVFVQFTYGLRPPVHPTVASALDLIFTRSPRIWTNLPPAVVYTYRRANGHPAPVAPAPVAPAWSHVAEVGAVPALCPDLAPLPGGGAPAVRPEFGRQPAGPS